MALFKVGTCDVTIAELREIAKEIKGKAVDPKTVNTQAEADEMTANDFTGKTWVVGEEYYLLDIKARTR